MLQASNVEEQRIYVAGTSGSDDNDGKTTSTPFKTIDKAFKAIEEYGYTAIRIRILESGTYISQAINICNISLHLQSMAPNVIISFENPLMSPSFYNSYLHFETVYDTENKTEFLTIKTLENLPMYGDHCGMAYTKVVFDGDIRSNFGNIYAIKTFAHYYQFRCAQVFLEGCGCDKIDATQPSLYMTNGFLRITGDFVTDTTVSGTPSTYCFRCLATVVDIRSVLTNVMATYTTPFSPEACLITGTIARLTDLMDGESRSPVAVTAGTKPTYTINLEGLTIGYLYFTRLLDGNAKIRFRIDLPTITNETYSIIPLFTLNNVLVKITVNALAYEFNTTDGDPKPRWCQISAANNGVVGMMLSSAESGKRYYGELLFNELTPTRIREEEVTP